MLSTHARRDGHARWNSDVRGETDIPRVDRNFLELLQELRVTQTGVQILFAFLLGLAFTPRFEDLDRGQEAVYLGALLLTAASAALLIAPVAYHRMVFRRRLKARLVTVTHRCAVIGLVLLLLAVAACVHLAASMVLGGWAALLAAGVAVLFVTVWFVVPWYERDRAHAGGELGYLLGSPVDDPATRTTHDRTTHDRSEMSHDAIVILKEDHQRIRKLFKEFEDSSPTANAARAKLVDRIIQELTVHTYLENEVMYPEVRRLVPDLEDDVLESYEEHHVADVLCVELMALEPTDEHFTAKTTVLIENVRHHLQEEEDDWFPKVREALSRKQLTELGDRMQELRDQAPRHPSQPSALKKAADALLS